MDINGQNPSDPNLTAYMLWSFSFFLLIWVHFIDSSKMISNSPEALNFNSLFLKLNRFIWK